MQSGSRVEALILIKKMLLYNENTRAVNVETNWFMIKSFLWKH